MRPDAVPPDDFDELVRRALDQLPDEAAALVAHIAVVVREEPEPDEVEPGTLLLGQFRGIARTVAGDRVPGSLPDVITLFRVPILRVCRSVDEVAPRVLKVLGHEVGHALGLSEGQLRAYGWY
ncbi:metallopeptidase family protein [Nocardioides anomalus]|uniref:Metallopeptidase family protein n=1 Tax=Nocardioides anomalus TaxID=2712223 RepID=A0A6G6WHX8_9ACTN|nr:metallopeptidase family protein [Nocardioides anomalus]QIG44941.1 metallopeptidase family protein [Nocardioides anomalus]